MSHAKFQPSPAYRPWDIVTRQNVRNFKVFVSHVNPMAHVSTCRGRTHLKSWYDLLNHATQAPWKFHPPTPIYSAAISVFGRDTDGGGGLFRIYNMDGLHQIVKNTPDGAKPSISVWNLNIESLFVWKQKLNFYLHYFFWKVGKLHLLPWITSCKSGNK